MTKFVICGVFAFAAVFIPLAVTDIGERAGDTTYNQLAASFLLRASNFIYTPLEIIHETQKNAPISTEIANKVEESIQCVRSKLYKVTTHILYDKMNFRDIQKIPEIQINFPSLNGRLIQDVIDLVNDMVEAGQQDEFNKAADDAINCLETLLDNLRDLTIAYRRIPRNSQHNFIFLNKNAIL